MGSSPATTQGRATKSAVESYTTYRATERFLETGSVKVEECY